MEKPVVDRRWIAGGLVGAAVLAGAWLLPKGQAGRAVPAPMDASATVPPALVRANESPDSAIAPVASPASNVFVYVTGAVKHPAVYRLPASARVIDAIARAGGSAHNADLEQLNLAEPLSDAMKIDVPIKGQAIADAAYAPGAPSSSGRGSRRHSARHATGGRHKLQAGQTLNINSASAQELTQLPGVGPGLARRIVEYRQQNGPFQTVDDLQNVPGIGPSKFEKLAPFVRL